MLLSFFLMYTFPRNLNININFFHSDLAWNWTIFKSPSWTMIFLNVFSWHSGNLRLNIFCTWVQQLLFADWKASKEHNPIAARRCLCEDCWPDECAEELSGNFSVRRSNGCDRAATTPRCILQNKCLCCLFCCVFPLRQVWRKTRCLFSFNKN